jgi:hypothetical protein
MVVESSCKTYSLLKAETADSVQVMPRSVLSLIVVQPGLAVTEKPARADAGEADAQGERRAH